MEIKTIQEKTSDILIVEKSKFITYFYPCDNKSEAERIISEVRSLHPDATHVCYGYIIYDESLIYKSSDDGEPSQTAGAPILNVLKKNALTNVICLVVRYFGGIKLGAGGLTRTYSNAASNCLIKCNIVNLIDAYSFEIRFAYDKTKIIDKILDNEKYVIIDKQYDLNVTYKIQVLDEASIDLLKDKISYLNVEFSNKQLIQIRK